MKQFVQTYFGMDVLLCLRGLCLGLIALVPMGCRTDLQQVSRQTDQQVYEIIEQKWDDTFGSPSDYQVEPFSSEQKQQQLQEVCDSEILTLAGAVELAVARSDEYQTAREELYLTALDLTDVRHLYEMIPFAGAVGGYAKDGDRETMGVQTQAGVQQLLATGATIGSGLTVGYLDLLSGDFRSGLSTIFQAAITQPLLRGADRKVVLENLTQAEQNTLYQIRAFNRFRQIFLVSVVTDYYTLLQAYDQYRNTQTNYLRLLELTDKMKDLADVGRLPRFELQQARQDKLKALDQFYEAKKLYKQQLDLFKLKLQIPPDQTIILDQNEWQALLESQSAPVEWSEQQALQAALDQRLDLANAFDQTLDAQRHIEVAADALKADLNLVGLVQPANDNSRRYVFGADPGDLQRVRDRYELSLRIDLPLDRLAERNNYKRALIELIQRQRNHLELTNQVIFEVRKAYRDLEIAQEHYINQQQALDLAKTRLDNTFLLLRYGRASTRDVLDAQKDYFQAQNAYAQAVTDYSVAKLNIYRDSGVLWVKPNGRWEARTTVKK